MWAYLSCLGREVFPTKPPRVEYRLAPLGQSMLNPLGVLILWADRHHGDIHAARQRYDANAALSDVDNDEEIVSPNNPA
ncbi:winged helix-turn-helix transcriptional regulator [Pseudomonas khavaziana]|uniref:winged helix-turn-helix transcriptional regulator n=1 Tax=Pseudomonas khavaziana TaxID=2842351 RepID=UPI001C3DE7B8|nr:winged helix-turn-helix transcriptional regulator [Pseudomonas khavaziana]